MMETQKEKKMPALITGLPAKEYRRRRSELLNYYRKHNKGAHKKALRAQRRYYKENKTKIRERYKQKYIYIPAFGKRKGDGQTRIYCKTGWAKKATPEMIKQIKEMVLQDCIAHPNRYLQSDNGGTTDERGKDEQSNCEKV